MAKNKEIIIVIKFLELAIAAACLGLHIKSEIGNVFLPLGNVFKTDMLSAAAFGGYVIILVGVLADHLMSDTNKMSKKKTDVFFSLVGCGLFVTAGALNIDYFRNFSGENSDYGLGKASLAIIGGALFLIDTVITCISDEAWK